jgi:hypothetical protein
MNKQLFTLALIATLGFASASPICYQIGNILTVEDADTVGAICYHYVGTEEPCPCASGPTTYADGQAVGPEGWDQVAVDPAFSPYSVNLYSGALMTFPTDACCPPPTWLGLTIECPVITDLGGCCTDGVSTYVTGLPSVADCVHDTTTYSAHTPSGTGDVSWGTSTGSVEVYGSSEAAGSCGGLYLYSVACPAC